MPVQNTLKNWDELRQIAKPQTSARWVLRSGQSPSTAPISRTLDHLAPGSKPPVLLYRDTNSWCPFCERVWFALEEKGIPYEVEFINLSDKPKWYTDMVPTGLVPAAKLEGELVYESKDILLALEERFGRSLLPDDPIEYRVARQLLEDSETSGFLAISYKLLRADSSNTEELTSLQAALEARLDELEQALAKYPGPYFLSTFSLVDIIYSPHLDRLAANLPVYRGYSIQGNNRFPRLNAWFNAIQQRPAYQRSASDRITNNLLLRRRFGIEPLQYPVVEPVQASTDLDYRAEAAARLSDNYEAAIGDILKNSGVQALVSEDKLVPVREAIDWHLRWLAEYLLSGHDSPLPGGRVGGIESVDPAIAAVGAITLAYVRNRICAPRDMQAGAATALRAAIDRILVAIY
ncbi:glutathione S-transferase N-terminal domain-containing protein [Phormidium tenue FACHB-886]|nr:glutathione S-transferase N-terminal domain-containing protein [Phormidium tenue FACHB-886]